MTRMITNPLWNKSVSISSEDVENMIFEDCMKQKGIVVRVREFLNHLGIGCYEAYMTSIPYEFGVGDTPLKAIEDLGNELVLRDYDKSVLDSFNNSEIYRR